MTNWKHTSTSTIPMDTELGRVVTYHEGLLSVKSRDSFVTWSCEITWQTKSMFPLPQYLWLPNMASWWLTLRASHPWSHPTLDHVVLRDHVTNLKHVSTTTIPMATKLGRVVTYNEELALINCMILYSLCFERSHDKLITLYLHLHKTSDRKVVNYHGKLLPINPHNR